MRHAFTVDVEDWYQGIPVDASVRRHAERRLRGSMELLLAMLARRGHKGTFFLLGPVAEEYPALVRELAGAGHEIGCHGWSHDLLYTMTRERFVDETRRAKGVLEDLAGHPVVAYRAAYFSITRASLWALEELARLGFRYDSSIFPVRNWRYGIPDFDPRPQRLQTPAGPLLELPLSVRRIAGRNLPVSGGAYFRLYPYAVTRANFRASEAAGRPVVFYLHPWELDPGHPRVRFHWKAWATHYARLGTTRPKLERLLGDFSFGTLAGTLDTSVA